MSQITLDTNPEEGMTAKSRKGKPLISYTPNTSTVEAIDTRTKEEKEAANKNAANVKPTGVYVKATRYGSPPKTRETSKCEGSSCRMMGGKRRKSRKQRGSRKNKQSRRR
jgi:hypothetical protein